MSVDEIMSDLQTPTQGNPADLVEVVRCKDCKHWAGEGICSLEDFAYHYEWDKDDYCSHGERDEFR